MIKDDENFEQFCMNFSFTQNALDMRNLTRWNGRDIGNKENLSEHTHLVVAVLMDLFDSRIQCDRYMLIKAAMLHDSLEMLRGDILSITKRQFPIIRQVIDGEEETFLQLKGIKLNEYEKGLLKFADIVACLETIKRELLQRPTEFLRSMYTQLLKSKHEYANILELNEYLPNYGDKDVNQRFLKGYAGDAGVDIILNRPVTFLPMSTVTFDLGVKITPPEGEMAMLFSRTSAANKGLVTASCPVDPNYNGNVMAIVHNISNDIIEFKAGEAFCQYVLINVNIEQGIPHRKTGKRGDGKLGSTGAI